MVEGSQSDYKTWKFSPQEITVPVGSTVVWRNEGNLQHDVKAEDGSFGSDLLDHGGEYRFTFTTAKTFNYYCSPHKDLGMVGVVKVVGGSTPTTAATTPTTQPTATTATTAPAGASTTTTTAKPASGASTTTTTAAANGATTTTLAPPVTPTSGPDVAAETTTTTAAAGDGEEAAADQGGEGHEKKEKKKNSPIGIAFASVSTVLLAAIAGKLLASKS
jgi:hypothetical protein